MEIGWGRLVQGSREQPKKRIAREQEHRRKEPKRSRGKEDVNFVQFVLAFLGEDLRLCTAGQS